MRRATHIRRPRHGAAPGGSGLDPRPPAGPRPEVLLAWALDRERQRVHVSSLDPRRRGERAPFACPGCGEPVVPRLGAVRARHFAHRPGSTCPLTQPETALHLNAKERLLFLCGEAFAGRLRVRLGARCPGCRREEPLDLAAVGDGAAAEAPLGTLRADVLVTCGGAPALALEVRVTHALDPVKEEALAALSIPALEIDAREPWEEELPDAPPGAARRGGSPPLVAVRVARTVGGARCGACQVEASADAGRAAGGEEAAVAELEAYRARGLLGPRPGAVQPGAPALGPDERRRIEDAFTCPECGGRELLIGERLLRHRCRGGDRPVAWRGYDGAVVELGWWRPR